MGSGWKAGIELSESPPPSLVPLLMDGASVLVLGPEVLGNYRVEGVQSLVGAANVKSLNHGGNDYEGE